MKRIAIAVGILFLFINCAFTQWIPSPSQIVVNREEPFYVGDNIGFNKTCHDWTRGASYWDFGDGTTISYPDDLDHGWQYHAYAAPGTYKVRYTHGTAFSTPVCGGFSPAPFTDTYVVTIEAKRAVTAAPPNPKADQLVTFQALNFTGSNLYWNFGDGTVVSGGPVQTHRYAAAGTYTAEVRETDIVHEMVAVTVSVSPDDRFIQASAAEILIGQPLTLYARNFNGDTVLWNFGDGTVLIGGQTISHVYNKAGNYLIKAVDEGGRSGKTFETAVKIIGLTDDVNLEIAELSFDNGKYYIVVPKNSDRVRPVLKLKMKGTGPVTGHWLVDGSPYGLISELARQGEVKEITTGAGLKIPTVDPGLHTLSFRLTRPETNAVFPTIRYYVLPYETSLTTLSPPDGFVTREDEVPEFSWNPPAGGAAWYGIAFTGSLFDLLNNHPVIEWMEVRGKTTFTPDEFIWKALKRNQWIYWQVKAYDSFNRVSAESPVNEMKIVIAEAEVTINRITTLDGTEISLGEGGVGSGHDMLLFSGTLEYKDDSDYLILRVYLDDRMTDQLLFRDVRKGEKREFETSVPGRNPGNVLFTVLKTSSPAVIVGLKGLIIKE